MNFYLIGLNIWKRFKKNVKKFSFHLKCSNFFWKFSTHVIEIIFTFVKGKLRLSGSLKEKFMVKAHNKMNFNPSQAQKLCSNIVSNLTFSFIQCHFIIDSLRKRRRKACKKTGNMSMPIIGATFKHFYTYLHSHQSRAYILDSNRITFLHDIHKSRQINKTAQTYCKTHMYVFYR